jgi:hypothetical protein
MVAPALMVTMAESVQVFFADPRLPELIVEIVPLVAADSVTAELVTVPLTVTAAEFVHVDAAIRPDSLTVPALAVAVRLTEFGASTRTDASTMIVSAMTDRVFETAVLPVNLTESLPAPPVNASETGISVVMVPLPFSA